MKCCMSTDIGTWTNWLTFEPDPDYCPDAGTRLLSPISYRLRNFAALSRLPESCAATQNFTSGKIPRIRIGGTPLERAVVLKWFYSLSRRKIFVRGKWTLSSALLVIICSQYNAIWILVYRESIWSMIRQSDSFHWESGSICFRFVDHRCLTSVTL